MFTGFWNSGNNSKTKGKVKLINQVLLMGIHESIAIFNAPDTESLFKITAPFHEPGAAHIHPVISLEETINTKKAKLKKLQENFNFLLIYLLFSF
jgi:uncharacterized protein with GYD domain